MTSLQPLTNGVFSVDWLSLTIFTSFDQVEPFIKLLGLDEGLEAAPHGTRGFSRLFTGLGGFRVGAEPAASAQSYCSLVLPGEAMHHVGLEKLAALFKALDESGLRWQPSRLDLAFDTQDFTVQDVDDARSNGLLDCRAKKFQEYRVQASYEENTLAGHTLYFGSRQSTCMLRVYHKTDGHSFGSEAFTRCELEMKDERAREVLGELIKHPLEHWGRVAAGTLSAFVYIEADWWHKFIDNAAAWWVAIKRQLSTIEKKRAWLLKQVSRSLATVLLAESGGDVAVMQEGFRNLIKRGMERLSTHDEALIDAYDPGARLTFAVDFSAS